MKRYYNHYTAGTLATDYQGQYWPRYDAGVGFAGLSTITAATNTAPIVLTTSTMACVPNVGDRVRVSGVQGNTAANGNWVVKASGAKSLTLLATKGDGAYASGGTVIPLTGACNTSTNWALSASSPYKARTVLAAPATDGSTAGKGPASDGTDVGVDIDKLNAAMGVGAQAEPLATLPSIRLRRAIPPRVIPPSFSSLPARPVARGASAMCPTG